MNQSDRQCCRSYESPIQYVAAANTSSAYGLSDLITVGPVLAAIYC